MCFKRQIFEMLTNKIFFFLAKFLTKESHPYEYNYKNYVSQCNCLSNDRIYMVKVKVALVTSNP